MLGPKAWRGMKPAIATMAGNAQHGAGDSPERPWSIRKDDLKWLVLAPSPDKLFCRNRAGPSDTIALAQQLHRDRQLMGGETL
jgi:hypothetical protein